MRGRSEGSSGVAAHRLGAKDRMDKISGGAVLGKQGHSGLTTMNSVGSPRVIYRDSRCPGCFGKITLKYQVTKVEDGWRWQLVSTSTSHFVCSNALAEIRREADLAAMGHKRPGRPPKGDSV